MVEALRLARPVVVTGYGGKEREVDFNPTCSHCGRRVANYLAIPWSLRCPDKDCRKQATSG
jgi:hypothetical protein